MAHYELYVCLRKADYEAAVPSVLQPKLGWNNYTYEADGETYRLQQQLILQLGKKLRLKVS